ncbi:coagulation factor X-like [Glandiceps talaboti]
MGQKTIGNLELREDETAKYPGVVRRVVMPEQCQWGLVNRCGGQVKVRLSNHYGYFFKRFFDRDSARRECVRTKDRLTVTADVNAKLCRNRDTWLNSISTTDALAIEFVAGAQRKLTYFGLEYDAYCGGWSGGDVHLNDLLNESWDDYDVTALKAPWIAMIWDTNTNQPFCSGVILSNRFILTSATCVSAARLRSTVEVSWEGVTIRLGKTESDKFLMEVRASEGTYGFTIGWAKLNPNNRYQTKLQRIPLRIQNWQTCRNNVDDDWPYKKHYFCTGHVDGDDGEHRCYGHDGAPFLKVWEGRLYLFGVVANDWDTWGNEGCPQRGNYGWFWRTVKIQDEIWSTICS